MVNHDPKRLTVQQRTTWRAILLGLVLSVPHSYLSIQTPTPSTVSLVYLAVLSLFLLVLLNLGLKRWLPRLAFSQWELLTLYTMISLSVAISGHDMMQVVMSILGHAYWFATPENEWRTLFFQYLPDWLIVTNPRALEGLYQGNASVWDAQILRIWLGPALWWGSLMMALVLTMLGINVLIRRQWMEHERLAYPIVQLPLAMTDGGGSGAFLKAPWLWAGIALAGGIDLINGMHTFLPSIPLIPIRTIEIGRYLTEKPLSAVGWTPVCFFPFVIGLSYFMPLDLAFSSWFFYLVWKFELVLGASLGLHSLPGFPYIKPQSSGAYLAIAVIALWSGRRHLVSVLRQMLSRVPDDLAEPMRYRRAMLCLLVGVAYLIFFCLKAGMSLWAFAIFFGFYYLLLLALTRLRAELGPPVNELYNIGPDQMLPRILGTRRLGPRNLTMFALFWGINRAHRSNPMPYQLEAFKLAEETRANPRRLVLAMFLACAVGVWVAYWGFLHIHYREGFGGGFGWEAYRGLERWLYYMPGTDVAATGFLGGGFALTILLTFLRRRLLWWSLHPVAYPLASSWTMNWMWFPILISWAIKRTLLKHGGVAAYRNAMPFFFGLVLGEYIVGGGWNLYGVLAHRYVYSFWH